jgi:ABC-type nitrate/sulfonate/bicarbonate transport system ATPase subunit
MERSGKLTQKMVCEHIQKTYISKQTETEVIRDISLTVNENEFLVIFGPGQCGKSTLLNICAGLESATHGKVYHNEKEVTGPGIERGVVYQTIALFPWLTVLGNVCFGPMMRGLSKEKQIEHANYFIKLVGLDGFENAFPVQLSGGMKQRVGIARAYANDPDIILMDEPFGHLDAQTRYLMQEEIARIWGNEKRTVIFVTNNLEEAIFLADRIILLTDSPCTIQEEYQIDLPRPRNIVDPKFLKIRKMIAEAMDINNLMGGVLK